MPEGHTVHRMAQDHARWFAGQRLSVMSPQGRFADEGILLNGTILTSVEAHGKHLFYSFGAKHVLHVHLGLYGKFRSHKVPPPEPRGAVRVRLNSRFETTLGFCSMESGFERGRTS